MGVVPFNPVFGFSFNQGRRVLLRREDPVSSFGRSHALYIGIGIGFLALVVAVGVGFWMWRKSYKPAGWVDEEDLTMTSDSKSSLSIYTTSPRKSWCAGPFPDSISGLGVQVPSPTHIPGGLKSLPRYSGFGVDYILEEYYRSPNFPNTPSPSSSPASSPSSLDTPTSKSPPSPYFDTPRTSSYFPSKKTISERNNGGLAVEHDPFATPNAHGTPTLPSSLSINDPPASPKRSVSLSRRKFSDQSALAQGPLPQLLKAIRDFTPKRSDELALRVGDVVSVLDEYADKWCLVERVSRTSGVRQEGVVPRVLLQDFLVHSRNVSAVTT